MSRAKVARAAALAAWLLTGATHAADLLSVVGDALEHDPALAASRDATRAAAQAVPKARAALLPHVSGGWGRAYNGIVMEDFPTQHYWQNGWTIGLTQPVFNWADWTAYRQADYLVARTRLQAASAQQDAILAAAQAYFDALAAADDIARATDYLHALDVHMALLARAKAAGEATLVDLRDGEASRAQAQLQLLDAQSQARLAHSALVRITGHAGEPLAALPPGGAPQLAPFDVEPWVTQAQAHGYGVQISEVALQIARFDTEKARAARYPSVDLQITHTPAGAAGGYSRPTTTTTGMLAVTIPIFSGGEVSAKVAEASALEDKARDELEAAVRDAGANARDGWLRVSSGSTRVAALQQLAQRTQAALDATRIGFGAGSRTSIDVLRATDAFYASRRDLIRARYDAVLALFKLLAQTATLDLDEVGRIDAQLFAAADVTRMHASRSTQAASAGRDGEVAPIAQAATSLQHDGEQPSPTLPPTREALAPASPPARILNLSAADMAPAAPASSPAYLRVQP